LRQPLIVDSEIDVFETDEVAEIFGRAIVELLRHLEPSKVADQPVPNGLAVIRLLYSAIKTVF
jgi:hypothetical protein